MFLSARIDIERLEGVLEKWSSALISNFERISKVRFPIFQILKSSLCGMYVGINCLAAVTDPSSGPSLPPPHTPISKSETLHGARGGGKLWHHREALLLLPFSFPLLFQHCCHLPLFDGHTRACVSSDKVGVTNVHTILAKKPLRG